MLARDDLHTLLDAIPEERLADVREALELLADEELAAIAEGEADIARGDVVPWEEYDAGPSARRESEPLEGAQQRLARDHRA